MEPFDEDRIVIGKETGAMYGEAKKGEDIIIRNKRKSELRKRSMLAKEDEEQQGEFIWSLFTYCDKLFPNLSHPNVTRLFYIATFVEYNGNRLTNDGGYTFFNKRKLKMKLNVTNRIFTDFWKEMVNNSILLEDDNKNVIINTSLFRKGNIDKRCRKDFTRVYCQCIRYIYENTSDIREHTKLSYIFKIIPYVNRKTNIVSYNPEELDQKKIRPMTIGDFCDVIGYSKANATRLFKDLLKFTVRGKHLMCYVAMNNINIIGMFIIVNPEIYYGGQEHHNAQFIFDVCDNDNLK